MSKKILILASSSRRRAQILKDCQIRFKILETKAKEIVREKGDVSKLVQLNAKIKARDVSKKVSQGIILGLDTLVLLNNKIIGKPSNQREARNLLKWFSGKKILVYTGIYIIDKHNNKSIKGWEKTELFVNAIKANEISKYLKYLGPFDKAGGFSIEGIGSVLFDNIRGSYFNVLGLPIKKLSQLLKRIGLDIFDFIKETK